jgi:hypothetical protein
MRPRTEKDIRRLYHQFTARVLRGLKRPPSAYEIAERLEEEGLIEFTSRDLNGIPLKYRETEKCWKLKSLDQEVLNLFKEDL